MAITLTLVENDVKGFQQPMEAEMLKSIRHLEQELVKIRTGRAHTSLIEDLPVSAYGQQPGPLKNLAVLSAPDARLITIQPWDKNIMADIERAIKASDTGLTPINDGDIIRIRLPEMSSTRREELIKILGKKVEECRVAIRNVRKEFNNFLRDAKKDKEISENFFNRLSDVLQKVTDTYIEKADLLSDKKEKEISTV
jgi:ribosome recycling factor